MKKIQVIFMAGLLLLAPAAFAQKFGKPANPTNLQIRFDQESGKTVFTWDAPEVDENGTKLSKENLVYQVYNSVGTSLGIVNEPRFERIECTSEFPTNVSFALRAGAAEDVTQTSTIVSGNVVKSDFVILRGPSKLPIQESYAQTEDIGMFDVEGFFTSNEQTTTGNRLMGSNDASWTNVTSQDGDNGYVSALINKGGADIKLISSYVDLSGTKNPVLVFYVLNRGRLSSGKIWDGVVCVDVQEEGSSEWIKNVYRWSDPTETQQWMEVEAPLAAFKGKTIRVQIRCLLSDIVVSHILDNFRLIDKVDNNLALSSFQAPKYVNRCEEAPFKVRVHNVGQRTVSKYKVTLYCNDKAIQTVEGPTLDRYRTGVVKFNAPTTAVQPSTSQYYVKLEYDDEIAHDNVSESKIVTLVETNRPFPTALAAKQANMSIALNWNAPDLVAPQTHPVTESFEKLDLFEYRSGGFGAWTVYDEDGAYTALATGTDAAYPTQLIPKAYTVFSDEMHGYGNMAANSGHKFLISTPVLTGKKNDWLISPPLSGEAQTVTFYVKSAVAKKAETYEILYSTKSTDITDFKSLEATTRSTSVATWTKNEASLPAGTRYFAIKASGTQKQSVFEIDDISYVPEVIEPGLEVVGYNVYRDGEKINSDIIPVPAYLDTEALHGEHIYAVSTVYNNGESRTSDPIRVNTGTTSINTVDATSTVVATEVYDITGVAVDPENLQPGKIYIEKVFYDDGTTRVSKRVIR